MDGSTNSTNFKQALQAVEARGQRGLGFRDLGLVGLRVQVEDPRLPRCEYRNLIKKPRVCTKVPHMDPNILGL